MFSNLWVIFLSMLCDASSYPSQEFYVIDFTFSLYSRPVYLSKSFQMVFQYMQVPPFKTKHMSFE